MKMLALLLVVVSTLVLSGCGNSNNGGQAAVPTAYGTTGVSPYGAGYPGAYPGYGAGYPGAYPGYGGYPGGYPGYGYPVGPYSNFGGGQPCDIYIAGSCGNIPNIICVPSFGQRVGVCQPVGYMH